MIKKYKLSYYLPILITIAWLLNTATASSQDTINIDNGTNTISVSTEFTKKSDYTIPVYLTSPDSAEYVIHFSPANEIHSDHVIKVSSAHNDTIQMSKGKVKRFWLKVDNVVNHGRYETNLTIKKEGKPVDTTKVIINLVAKDQISITHATPYQTIESDNSTVRRKLIPISMANDTISSNIHNSSNCVVNLEDIEISLLGQKTKKAVGEEMLDTSKLENIKLGPHESQPFHYPVNASNLPADEYTGKIFYRFNSGIIKSADIILNVRSGWVCPLVLLMIGIAMGHISKVVDDSAKQIELLEKAKIVEAEINALGGASQEVFTRGIRDLRPDIYMSNDATHLAKIESRLLVLRQSVNLARRIENLITLAPKYEDELKEEEYKEALDRLEKALGHTHKLENEQAEKIRKDVNAELKKNRTIQGARTRSSTQAAPAPIPAPTRNAWQVTILNFIKEYVRPLLYAFFTILSALYVYKLIYLDNAVYGVNGIYDDVKMLLAGISIVLVIRNVVFGSWLKILLRLFNIPIPS